MGTIRLPHDFKEFLNLLSEHKVDYLLVGGFAVALHGHIRTTADIDFWIQPNDANALRVTEVLKAFGFGSALPAPHVLRSDNQVIRMGVPPMRIELITSASGVDFAECHQRRWTTTIEDVKVDVISLEDLRANKAAAGRPKDLADLSELI
jgi:hypothetical protein